MALPVTNLGTPVISSRQWTTGLSPRNGGGWDFITQSYNYPNAVPSEWVVLNLETGGVQLSEGPTLVASNSNFQIALKDAAPSNNNQIRASNGRIFFPEFGTNVAYFDPADRQVRQIPPIADPGTTNAIVFQMVFNKVGDKLFGSTQVSAGQEPLVFSLDPATLATAIVGHVGSGGSSQVTYGYYLACENGTPLIYVAVGQDPWELWSLNINTGVATQLEPGAHPGPYTHIEFVKRTQGWEVDLNNGTLARFWLADGVLYPGAPVYNNEFTARDVTPYSNPLVSPPLVDYSRGIGQTLWKAAGPDPYTLREYNVTYTAPINLESLFTESPQRLLGNAQQYQGFWAYNKGATITDYGVANSVTSQPVWAKANNLVYFAGYPNGVLWQWQPGVAWDPGANPVSGGNFFPTSDIKYPYFLLEYNGYLYCAGRRERDGTGTGIGRYSLSSGQFSGTIANPLNFYDPRGFVAAGDKLVYSGIVHSDPDLPGQTPNQASLMTFSPTLQLLAQYTIPGAPLQQATGYLWNLPSGLVMGVTANQAYQFDPARGVFLQTAQLTSVHPTATAQRADGSVWCVQGTMLTRVDPVSMAVKTYDTVPANTSLLAWQDDTLYLAADANLYSWSDPKPASRAPLRRCDISEYSFKDWRAVRRR